MFTTSLLTSCKKEHLYDEREIFIGSWDWHQSIEFDYCSPIGVDTSLISTLDNTYRVEITKREKTYLLVNEEVEFSEPINVLTSSESSVYEDGFSFKIFLGESNSETIAGHVSPDSLRFRGFWPSELASDQCTDYINIFYQSN